jgi:adenine/guanine phosphoribosyltransferase-like PRPP-binding protein
MGYPAFSDGVPERSSYVLLADDILKTLGTASAGENLV